MGIDLHDPDEQEITAELEAFSMWRQSLWTAGAFLVALLAHDFIMWLF